MSRWSEPYALMFVYSLLVQVELNLAIAFSVNMYFIVTCVSVKKNNENLYDFRSPSATVAFGGHIEMKLLY